MYDVDNFEFEFGFGGDILGVLGWGIFLATFSPNWANFFLNCLVTLDVTQMSIIIYSIRCSKLERIVFPLFVYSFLFVYLPYVRICELNTNSILLFDSYAKRISRTTIRLRLGCRTHWKLKPMFSHTRYEPSALTITLWS